MRIAVVGLGVAGSYLLNSLSEEHEVEGFEMQREGEFDAVCAWGTSRSELSRIFSPLGIDFKDYLFFEGTKMDVELKDARLRIPLKGLCTYDKHQLELDLCRGKKANFGMRITPANLPSHKYDLVIDATSLQRALLPRIDAKNQLLVPCLEYMIEYDNLPYEDFYIKPFPENSG